MSAEQGGRPRGLPGPLPAGERILWQGSPDWRALALRAFHGREVAAWFAALAAWRFWSAWSDGASFVIASKSALTILPVALAGLGLLALLAWGAARCAVYTVT
ncbi:MAG: PH domain-containing protein, partial [Hansschlegelia sp.]